MKRPAPSPYPDMSHCWTGRLLCIMYFLVLDAYHAPHLYVSSFSLEPMRTSTSLHTYNVSPFYLEPMRTSTTLHTYMWVPSPWSPWGPALRSTPICESLLLGAHEDQHHAPHLYVNPFSLELMRTGTMLHTCMWVPSLWSRWGPALRSTPLCEFLLFGADEDQHSAPHLYVSPLSLEPMRTSTMLQILFTSETTHHTTLCLPSLWSLRLAAPRPPPDYRKSYLSISSHVPPISP